MNLIKLAHNWRIEIQCAKMKFTKTAIEALPVNTERQVEYFTDHPKGFGIRVSMKGKKVYFVDYRTNDRRKKKFTIGPYDEIPLEKARKEAEMVLGRVRNGEDPQSEKMDTRRQVGELVSDLAHYYLEHHAKERNEPATVKRNTTFINMQILPLIGRKRANEVKRSDIELVIDQYRSGKTSQEGDKVANATCNRLLALLKKMFNLAVDAKWITENPAKGILQYKENSRNRICTDFEEKAFLNEILAIDNLYYKAYFLTLWFTMARRAEIQMLKWEQVDFDSGLIRLPKTKAGRPFVINLPNEVLEIIKTLPKIVGNPYVFASDKAPCKPINGIGKAWSNLRKKLGVSDIRIHDIRRTGGSNMIMNGASLQDVAMLLNHSNLSTTQRYAQLAEDHKKKKMNEHGDRISKLIRLN